MSLRPRCTMLSVIALGLFSSPAQAQASLRLRGVVLDASRGEPLSGAAVFVEVPPSDSTRTAVFRTRTNQTGTFELRGLRAREYVVHVREIGYAPVDRRITLRADMELLTIQLSPVSANLAAVTVRGDTVVERLSRVAATSALDATELATVRGQTIGESLKHLPGVSVIQFGPSIAKPVIRGLNSQRVLVMNSGLRQEDQQWGTEHAPNIDGFDADQVTVVRGAATVLYGPDAIGGMVRVDRSPVPDSGSAHGDAAVNLFSNSRQGAMSVGVRGGAIRVPLLGTAGYRVRLTSRVAGNASAPDYALANTGFRELNGSAALGVHRPWGMSELSLSRFATELGVLQQSHAGNVDDLQRNMTTPPTDPSFRYEIGRPNQQVDHTTARLRVVRGFAAGNSLEIVYGFQFNHRREYDAHGPLRNQGIPAFNLRLFTNSLDARFTHALWRGWRGTVGTSALQQGNQTLGKAFLIPGFDLWQVAVFAQEERALSSRVTLSASGRTDLISQTTLAYADQGIRSAAGTQRWSDVSGSFGIAFAATPALDLSVRAARAWRPPTVNERYAQGVHHGTAQYERGDAALTPERSSGVETTLHFHGTRVEVDAAAYTNWIQGFMYLRPTAPVLTLRGSFPAYRYSQTGARLAGAEFSGRLHLTTHAHLQMGGTLVRGTDRTLGGSLFDMPADRMNAALRIDGGATRLGEWWITPGVTVVRRQAGVPNGTIYTLPTRGYSLASLDAGSRGIAVLGRTFDLSVSITNAANTRYRDYLSRYRLFVNDAGRDVVVRITAPF
jgi:iron complex outermembrane recepter protein